MSKLDRSHTDEMLEAISKVLPPMQSKVLWLRYGCNLTMAEVAEEIGRSRMQTYRILAKANDTMKRYKDTLFEKVAYG